MKTQKAKNQTKFYLIFLLIIMLFACNSTDSKFKRIKEIDKEIYELEKSTNALVTIVNDVIVLQEERDKIIAELKLVDKSKLTPAQISIIYKEDNKFIELFSKGKEDYSFKQYSEAIEYFDTAKDMLIKNDSLEIYYDAARVYSYSEAIKDTSKVEYSTSDPDTIAKVIKNIDNISLLKESEKKDILKDLINLRDKRFIEVYSFSSNVQKDNGIFQYQKEIDFTKKKLLEFKKSDSLYGIFANYKIKTLYNKIENMNKAAYVNLLIYGQPKLEDLEIAARTYLNKTMNDPSSLEIVEKEDFATQFNNGYTYKMKIRGSNAFGATITQVKTFYCRFDSNSGSYYCEIYY